MPFLAHVNTSFLHENNAMLCHARRPLSTRNPLSSDPIASLLPSSHPISPRPQNPFISQPACPLRSSLAHRLRSSLHGSHQPYSFLFPIIFPGKDPFKTVGVNVLGGRAFFNLSAFSLSFKTSVYSRRWHRTLNLIWLDFLLRFMRAEEASLRWQIWRNCFRDGMLAS
jgi:hypothetical protein